MEKITMNKLDFLPLTVYEFDCDDALVERIAAAVCEMPFSRNLNNALTDTDLFYDAELYEWFNACIREAKGHLQIPKEVNLDITGCWANRTKKLQQHHRHTHPNSFMSGILYLSDSHRGGNTEFTTKNTWWNNFGWLLFNNNATDFPIRQTYTPKKGKLLLLPSGLEHRVNAVADNSVRYTIAFNTFFSGPICGHGDTLTRLEIKSKSVADENET
jgi:uncharacterized protein (TIGR02466 family)